MTKKSNRTRSAPAVRGGSGVRSSAKFDDLELDTSTSTRIDPELDLPVFKIVTAVGEEEGRSYPPAWLAAVDAAKRAGYLRETGLRLFLTQHGRLWLASRASRVSPGAGGPGTGPGGSGTLTYTMTKIDPVARLALKDLARETGVPMQEALGFIVSEIHANRDALTRVAHSAGLEHPWEAIRALLRAQGKR